MTLICITDDPYMRDFYHWVLQGHCEGYDIPVDEGFEWKEEEGEIKTISIGYPKTPFWYELGHKPDYLSSRKIYYYRAWQTYMVEGELVLIEGEWKQFTAINPMCTGFTNFDAKRMMKKYYSYHGVIMPCNIQANPETLMCIPEYVDTCPWELWKDVTFESAGNVYFKYVQGDFYPSSDIDPCAKKFTDGMARYYYCEVTLYYRYGPGLMGIFYNNGLECKSSFWTYNNSVFHKAWFNRLWQGSNILVWVNPSRLPTNVKIWRTICGEYNENWPVPPV